MATPIKGFGLYEERALLQKGARRAFKFRARPMAGPRNGTTAGGVQAWVQVWESDLNRRASFLAAHRRTWPNYFGGRRVTRGNGAARSQPAAAAAPARSSEGKVGAFWHFHARLARRRLPSFSWVVCWGPLLLLPLPSRGLFSMGRGRGGRRALPLRMSLYLPPASRMRSRDALCRCWLCNAAGARVGRSLRCRSTDRFCANCVPQGSIGSRWRTLAVWLANAC